MTRRVVVDLDGEQLCVVLDNDDGDGQWGSARDSRGNRVEVYVFDGDPYDTACPDCRTGPCSIALMPGEACPCGCGCGGT